MPATNYKVWAWGSSTNIGVTGSCHVGVAGIARRGLESGYRLISFDYLNRIPLKFARRLVQRTLRTLMEAGNECIARIQGVSL